MRSRLLYLTFCATFLLAPAVNPAVGEETEKPETEDVRGEEIGFRTEIPELQEFHEVIHPLWHTAWPDRDYLWMKDLLPRVKEHVKAVQAVKLPENLHHAEKAWNEGVADLTAALREYEKAVTGDNDEALLAAVDEIHSVFETLMLLVRPPMDELDAYHAELYKIYHRHLPDQDMDQLRASALLMAERCGELTQAEVPCWYKGQPERLEAAVHDLCMRTEVLNRALKGEDWDHITDALETVHTYYQKVERLFE